MSKKWKVVLLVLSGLLLFFAGWTLAQFYAPKPALPPTETILEGYSWFEEESSADANRDYYFDDGKFHFSYSDIDGNDETFTVDYRVLDNGNLYFDHEAVKTIKNSEFFYVSPVIDSMELSLAHIDRESTGDIYSISVVWKDFNNRGDFIGAIIRNRWLQQVPED